MKTQTGAASDRFSKLQEKIVEVLERLDGSGRFAGVEVARPSGAVSRPKVLTAGDNIEKAAVQFTVSAGEALPPAATERNPRLAGQPFEATAVSVIVHPWNPHVPTTHLNIRFFIVGTSPPTWYFGGGFDLTPHFPYLDDAVSWHQAALDACGSVERYQKMKAQCDEYFSLPHRGETRGIGGIFFDDWNSGGFDECLEFANRIGDTFIDAYESIFRRRVDTKWSDEDEEWMLIRRGRYAEFNLAIDRGTKYGLQSGRRIESVLASLPPRVKWVYDHEPPKSSPQRRLLDEFLQPRDWLNFNTD